LLLTLGDTRRAAQLAGQALAEGSSDVDRLRHPERAAAWLRSRVVRTWRGGTGPRHGAANADALEQVGAEPAVVAGLAALDRIERAALVASAIERLDVRDVGVIVGREGRSLQRLLAGARARYAAAFVAAMPDAPAGDGPLATRLHDLARRTIG
jgi:hypothetical protein